MSVYILHNKLPAFKGQQGSLGQNCFFIFFLIMKHKRTQLPQKLACYLESILSTWIKKNK